jgi:hypothetical protein
VWYVSYRIGGKTRMEVLKTKEEAIECVRPMLDDPQRSELEVGPMLLPLKGNVLTDDQLRKRCGRVAK